MNGHLVLLNNVRAKEKYLDKFDLKKEMKWIPGKLPPFVKVILSIILEKNSWVQGAYSCLNTLLSRSFLDIPYLSVEVRPYLFLTCFLDNVFCTPQDSSAILKSLLKASNRTITEDQEKKALSLINQHPLPLYIRLMADVCRELHSYDEFPVCIDCATFFRIFDLFFFRISQEQFSG